MDVKWKRTCSLRKTWKNTLRGRVPLDPPPFKHTVKILTQRESKLLLTLMYQTLCLFELLIVHERGLCRTPGCILRSFHTSSEVVPGERIQGWRHNPAQSAFLEEVGNEKSLLVRRLTSGKAATERGANGILVWWLSRHRASGSRGEHIHLRKENQCYRRKVTVFTVL